MNYRIIWHGPPLITYSYDDPSKALRKANTLARIQAQYSLFKNGVPMTLDELAQLNASKAL